MKFNTIALTASALLAASYTTASHLDNSGVDRLLMITRGNHQLSAEKVAALGEQYERDHPEAAAETAAAYSRRQVHARIAASKRGNKKRCKAKTASTLQATSDTKTTLKQADTEAAKSNKSSSSNNNNNNSSHNTTSKSASKDDENKSGQKDSQSSSSSSSSSSTKTFSATGGSSGRMGSMKFAGACSSSGADDDHPNGANWFLTCGMSKSNPSGKWTPPKVAMQDLKMISSSEAASSSVFKPCSQYKDDFEKAAEATGVPVVLLMSFALQESTCQADQTGPNGEIGLMQITKDKCPSSGNCKDPATNIMIGAKYFASQLQTYNGDVLSAVGSYNGWSPDKMSYSSTMAMKQYGCAAQQNLDYLDGLLNGYCQGKDGTASTFKTYNNLAACG